MNKRIYLLICFLLITPLSSWSSVYVKRFPTDTAVLVCQPSDSDSNCGGGGNPFSITSFTNNKNTLEIGTTVTSTVLNWTTSATPASLSINQGIGTVSAASTSYTDGATYTTNRTYTLTANGTVTRNTSVAFDYSNYLGVNASASLNDGQINALPATLSTSKAQTVLGLSASAQYIWTCYPASYGTATFHVNGLLNTAFTLTVQTHVNASGASASYNCYNSNNLLTGTYDVQVS